MKFTKNAYNTNNSIVPKPLATAYRYDQLNRLVEVAAFDNFDINNSWKTTGLTGLNQYSESFSYDGNGNILKATRKGNLTGAAMAMDNFEYQYSKNGLRLQNNKLNYVTDLAINSGNYVDDVDNQNSNNYNYDEIGNLIKDEAEEIENIEWNLYGKIKKITRKSNSSKADLEFTYNSGGQRLSKTVKPRVNGVISNQKDWKTTWYVRDAGGNPLATYIEMYAETQNNGNNYLEDKLTLLDFNITGAGRLGIANANLNIKTIKTQFLNNQITYTSQGSANLVNSSSIGYTASVNSNKTQFYLGNKNYELSNHLGNVLAVVSDRKHMVDDGQYDPITGAKTSNSLDNLGDYFVPEYQSFGLYYAYGATMPGTTYASSSGLYRFGFNGQERDNEVEGNGNINTAEFWEYDTRLGRRWNLDPVYNSFESRFCVNGNNPVFFIDPNGNFKTKFGALLYMAINGGKSVGENSNGQWLVYSERTEVIDGHDARKVLILSRDWTKTIKRNKERIRNVLNVLSNIRIAKNGIEAMGYRFNFYDNTRISLGLQAQFKLKFKMPKGFGKVGKFDLFKAVDVGVNYSSVTLFDGKMNTNSENGEINYIGKTDFNSFTNGYSFSFFGFGQDLENEWEQYSSEYGGSYVKPGSMKTTNSYEKETKKMATVKVTDGKLKIGISAKAAAIIGVNLDIGIEIEKIK